MTKVTVAVPFRAGALDREIHAEYVAARLREMLPDAALGEKSTWEALITKGMPQMALIRQLPRITRAAEDEDRPRRHGR